MNRHTLGAAGLLAVLAAVATAMVLHLDLVDLAGDRENDRIRGDQEALAEESASSGTANDADERRLAARGEPGSSSPVPETSIRGRIEAAGRSLEQARARRNTARDELVEAEAEMEQVERQVEEVERFVADLEARGEDPTRHVDEGLALLHPTLERYRQTADRIERAQRTLETASEALTAAERTLEDLREQASRD